MGRLGVTETMMKPVPPDEAVATARRLIERRRLQELTGLIGESEAMREVMVKIEQMAPGLEHGAHRGRERHGQGARRAGAPRLLSPGATSRSSP